MRLTLKAKKHQTGQTLVETVVAIFILVMGITAALGLSGYSLSSSSNITKHIIAMGLAREGIEAVKNIRDTNWLEGSLSNDCYNFTTGNSAPDYPDPNGGARCYKNWEDDINPNGASIGSAAFVLGFNSSLSGFWDLQQASNNKFGLDFESDNPSLYGQYRPNTSEAQGSSPYYRMITIEEDNSAPFNHTANNDYIGPRLKVKSQVWWTDKKCPRSSTWPGAGKCSVELQMYLTNWKNY